MPDLDLKHLLPSFRFSSNDFPEPETGNAWVELVSPLFTALPVVAGAAVDGEMEGYFLGGMVAGRSRYSAQVCRRDQRLIAATGADHFFLQLYLEGGLHGTTDGRVVSVGPNDICLLDLLASTEVTAEQSSTVSMLVPRAMLGRHCVVSTDLSGTRFDGASAIGELLGAHLLKLAEVLPRLTVAEGDHVADATAALIGGCLAAVTVSGARSELSPAQTLRNRALELIDANLASTEFSPDILCRTLNVSRAHLYRVFKDIGGVARVIQDRRLNRAFFELHNPANRDASIAAIAYGCGFADNAHFSRTFRETFGLRPKDARDRAITPRDSELETILTSWMSVPNKMASDLSLGGEELRR